MVISIDIKTIAHFQFQVHRLRQRDAISSINKSDCCTQGLALIHVMPMAKYNRRLS